jgi:hypothetical protein
LSIAPTIQHIKNQIFSATQKPGFFKKPGFWVWKKPGFLVCCIVGAMLYKNK